MPEFEQFQKIPRLSREVVITEKIDGTNGQIFIKPEEADDYLVESPVVDFIEGMVVYVGSRTRWITPGKNDNYGFAGWVKANVAEIIKLGPGHHFGEWWGAGIQRTYGLAKNDKRFSLFNVSVWGDDAVRPPIMGVVPVLWRGEFSTIAVDSAVENLRMLGSAAVPGYMKPEGVVIYHIQGGILFKKTLENDGVPKGKQEAE